MDQTGGFAASSWLVRQVARGRSFSLFSGPQLSPVLLRCDPVVHLQAFLSL